MRPQHISEDEFKAMEQRVKNVGINNEVAPRLQRVAPVAGPRFRSKWEENYAAKLDLEKKAGLIKAYWYEPFSLWLPGKVRYKPDFMVWIKSPGQLAAPDEWLEVIEVKGWSKNRRDGMTRLKIAAALFPCFVWRLVYRQGNGWSGEYV